MTLLTKTVAAGVDMAMASRAVYSNLDPTYPGLIKAIVQNELRGRLGFTGVTINDAMEEGVLGAFGGQATRRLLAA